jgi:glycerol uptake facilitator-like aquaporin
MSRRALAAEGLGTALLVATVVGSGIMAERLAGGNAAIALLGNTAATGAVLYVLISLFAPISGASFNPAVTLVLGRRDQQATFIAVQIVGACLGTLLAHFMFALPAVGLHLEARTGPGQWLGEFVATFGLILTIMLGSRWRPASVPALVALWIVAGYWFTSSTSFANPAVTIARALTGSFAGIRWIDVPMFIAAQCAGAICGRICAHYLISEKTHESDHLA